MEIGMTVDAVRGGYRLGEYELDLEHRASGRTVAGFRHRAVQLRDFARVYVARRR
jgi:glucosyl-3-phosphoglycerate synthase